MGENETFNVRVPEPLKEYVFQQVNEGGYGTISEYIEELIRADQRRKSQEKLESLVLEGLETPAQEMSEDDWEELRRRVWDRHNGSGVR